MRILKAPKAVATELIRISIIWLIQFVGILVAVRIIDGFIIDTYQTALELALVLGLLNALLWPVLTRITLALTVFTFGLATLVFNGLFVLIAAELVPGVEVASLWSAIGVAFWLTVVTTIFSTLFSIDDDSSYYRNVVKKHFTKNATPKTDKPGLVFLEIDGLSGPIFKQALENGSMPTLKSWLDQKTYKYTQWETDLSCQTGASQAGILHGNNADMPAFRWVEKANDNKIMTSTGPSDAPVIEKRHSNGKGLLAIAGASRSNLFSGDATDAIFTYSRLTNIKAFYNNILFAYFAVPYNLNRTLALFVLEIALEYRNRIYQKVTNTLPRLGKEKRGKFYPAVRAFVTVLLRDLTTYTLIGDIFAGEKDVVYATYVAYDEVAHHSGVGDRDAFMTLGKLDKSFARIASAATEAQRKYDFVILSDHGQSKGATFKQRYKITLEDLVRRGMEDDKARIKSRLDTEEGWEHLNMVLTGAIQDKDSAGAKTLRKLVRKRMYKGSVVMSPEFTELKAGEGRGDTKTDVIVLASGNLGLIYFTKWKTRLTYEQITKKFPNMLIGLAQHDGIGFVLVQSAKFGPLVIGKKGVHHLKTGKIEGQDPLKPFGPNAKRHLLRTNSFKYVPDILVNSMYNKTTEEGAAFEELIGFHGGMGGNQSRPFIFYPAKFKVASEPIVGAENVYKVFKEWAKATH